MTPIPQPSTNPITAFPNDRLRDTAQAGFNRYGLISGCLYLMRKRLFKPVKIEVQQCLKIKQDVPLIILTSRCQQTYDEIIHFPFDSVGRTGQQRPECSFFQRFPKKGIIFWE
uniref:hypothetical protein n=1 Tax=Salmonella enterica TaxID=28901 RepID=UPI00311B034D